MKGSRRALSQSRLNGWNFRHRTSWIVHSSEAGMIRSTAHQRIRFLCSWSPTTTSTLQDGIPVWPQLMMSSQKFSSLPPGESKPKAVVDNNKSATIGDSHTVAYVASEAEELIRRYSAKRQQNTNAVPVDYVAAELLLVSAHLTTGLTENILQQKSPSSAAIHKAFLTVISWCLDDIAKQKDLEEESHNQEIEETVLDADDLGMDPTTGTLNSAIVLARRAHELCLPLHLPLYEQLVEMIAAASKNYDSTIAVSSVSLILEVSSWVEATLDVPVDSSLFRSPLSRFIKNGRFLHAHELLTGMRTHHGIVEFDGRTTVDLLVTLDCALRDMPESLFTGKKANEASEVSFVLEQSLITKLIFGEGKKEDEDEEDYCTTASCMRGPIRERFAACIENQSDEVICQFMQYLQIIWVDALSLPEDETIDADDRDVDLIELWYSEDEQEVFRLKKFLFDSIKDVRPSSGSDVPESKGRIHWIDLYEDKERKLLFRAAVMESDENEDVKWNEEVEREELADLIYSHTCLGFPDITYQLNELSGGQQSKFSREFEKILGMRYHKDDMEFMERVKEPRFNHQDNDDDDSDDGIDSDDGF